MTILNLSIAFDTTAYVDPARMLDTLYSATKDGVLCVDGIPYDEGIGSYRCIMNKLWGREDEAIAVHKVTKGSFKENAPFADECELRTVRLLKLEKLGAPQIVVENERFFLTLVRFFNAYAEEVEVIGFQGDDIQV